MKERKAFDFLLIFCLFISSKMIERVALELQIGEGRGHAVHHRPQNIQTHHHHYHLHTPTSSSSEIRMSPINIIIQSTRKYKQDSEGAACIFCHRSDQKTSAAVSHLKSFWKVG